MLTTTLPDPNWLQERELAEFDRLLAELKDWAATAPSGPPFDRAKALLARVEPRLRELQINLDRVLVVGLIGGSGTGKSTLINALLGERVSEAGDVQRPTTRRPVVVVHDDVDPSFLQLDDADADLQRRRLPILESMILIDCPDPDTQATHGVEHGNRNREVLRKILPQCDVLLYLGTAQKYKTHAVTEELLRHAPGRQIVPVQTHASTDEDIRDDWRKSLEQADFSVPVMFRIDSEDALRRREEHRPVSESFEDLQAFLQRELSSRARHRIKRANVLDLLHWVISQIQTDCEEQHPAVLKLQEVIGLQRAKLLERVRTRLIERIRRNQHLWRSRLLRQVTMSWGGGPFASFLWLINSLSSLLRLIPLARARSLVPLLLAGGVAVGKSITDRWRETMAADEWIAGADLGITEADLTEGRSILLGYAQGAGIDPHTSGAEDGMLLKQETLLSLARQLYARVESEIDAAIERRVARKAGAFFHFLLEILFCIVPGYLIYHMARNFFYDHPFRDTPLLGLEYWAQAGLWVLLWGLLLRGLLVWRLRSGLRRDVNSLLQNWTPDEALSSLFADLDRLAAQVLEHVEGLRRIGREVERLQDQFGGVSEWKLARLR